MVSSTESESLPLGPHGGDVLAVAQFLGVPAESILDLSASLNPYPPPMAELVATNLGALGRYSSLAQTEATLAEYLEVDAELVVVTNGGSEAIALVAQLWPSGWVEEPEFSLYRRHLRHHDPHAPQWRSNPHSPSGRLISNPTIHNPAYSASVWDEAYWPMSTGTWTSGLHQRGAIVLGSLTKVWASPGLRLGYIITPTADLAFELREFQPRWSVGALAAAVMRDALAVTDLSTVAQRITQAKANLVAALKERDLAFEAHEAPWVLIHQAPNWRTHLAHQEVLVRDCRSFGLPNTIRVAIPSATNLPRLLSAIDMVLDTNTD